MTRPRPLICAALLGATAPLWVPAAMIAFVVTVAVKELIVLAVIWRGEK